MTSLRQSSANTLQALRQIARDLVSTHLLALASAVEAEPGFSARAHSQAMEVVASPAYRQRAEVLLQAWETEPDLSGAALALAIRAAVFVREDVEGREDLDLVWTGPTSPSVPVRLTRQVLLDLINEARVKLKVVSFAAYDVQDIIVALLHAAERGVDIGLILETSEDSRGRLSHDAAKAFESLRGRARFYVWPGEARPVSHGGTAALHAKAGIADASVAFVTSANLTGHALATNMELGLLVRGGPIPARLDSHFDELIARGILRPVRA